MKVWICAISIIVLFSCAAFGGGFDDFLKEVLTETGTQPINSNEYVFAPGDPVIQKETYTVYYAGSEILSNARVLLLEMTTTDGVITLKYPNPEEIRVKGFRLHILSFDNMSLRVRILER